MRLLTWYESAESLVTSPVRSRFVDCLVSHPPDLPHMSWQSDEQLSIAGMQHGRHLVFRMRRVSFDRRGTERHAVKAIERQVVRLAADAVERRAQRDLAAQAVERRAVSGLLRSRLASLSRAARCRRRRAPSRVAS